MTKCIAGTCCFMSTNRKVKRLNLHVSHPRHYKAHILKILISKQDALTYIGMIQDLHYSNFSEELKMRKIQSLDFSIQTANSPLSNQPHYSTSQDKNHNNKSCCMSLSTEHFHEEVSMKSDYPSGLYELTCPFSS